jgi:Fe-S cluster assembly ATPase SufC
MLEIKNLNVRLQTQRGPADAIRGVSFSMQRGETVGLVGESGCGKSITAMALMGLLPESAVVTGSIRFDGQELLGQPDAVMRRIRGNRIGMVFQEPMTALNPVHTIGDQVAEPLRLHRAMSREQARTQTIGLLERVGIANAANHHGHPVLRTRAEAAFSGFRTSPARIRTPPMLMPKRAPCDNRCPTSTVPRSTGAASDSAMDGNSRPVAPGPAPQSGSNSSSGPAVMH